MPQAEFEPGSISDSLLEFENSALNRSATTAGLSANLVIFIKYLKSLDAVKKLLCVHGVGGDEMILGNPGPCS